MPQPLRWPLVAVWLIIGSVVGLALHDPFTRWALLLVPAALAAVFVAWQIGVGRELGAALVGLSLLPIVGAIRVRNPPCPVDEGFAACNPGSSWPGLLTAALLVVVGVVIMVRPGRPAAADPPR